MEHSLGQTLQCKGSKYTTAMRGRNTYHTRCCHPFLKLFTYIIVLFHKSTVLIMSFLQFSFSFLQFLGGSTISTHFLQVLLRKNNFISNNTQMRQYTPAAQEKRKILLLRNIHRKLEEAAAYHGFLHILTNHSSLCLNYIRVVTQTLLLFIPHYTHIKYIYTTSSKFQKFKWHQIIMPQSSNLGRGQEMSPLQVTTLQGLQITSPTLSQ